MQKRISGLLIGIVLGLGVFTVRAQKSPDEFFKVAVGGDRTLIAYPRIVEYFRHLETNSPRLKLNQEGMSTLGLPLLLAVISSAENIRDLPRLLETNRKLANPDLLAPAEARELIAGAKAFVLITCSLHASEIGASQMAMSLAHDLVSGMDQATRHVLDQTVLLLMPSINPDGQVMICDWYQKYLGTSYEGGSMPYLYHHYAGHDNNRDYFMLNLKESRVLNAVLHRRYFPHVFLDMHQMGSNGPRIFVPPFKDPFNQNLSPLMLREVELIGASMALALQAAGKQGVANSYGFDAYWPGGTKNTAWYKNVVGLLTELASVRIATPVIVDASELRAGEKGLPEYKPQVNFPDPWPGGVWRLRDIIDYERIACRALLETVAGNRNMFVEGFQRMGLENARRGKTEAPFAYVLPKRQWDEPEALSLVKKMLEHGVRVSRLSEDWIDQQRIYEKGSYVIPLAQPYRSFIKAMFERQRYPEIRFTPDGPIMEPYDATGWTLPLLMNVKTEELGSPLVAAPLEAVVDSEFPLQAGAGQGGSYLLPGRFNRTYLAVNRLLKKGLQVFRAQADGPVRAGDFLVGAVGAEAEIEDVCRGTGVAWQRIAVTAQGEKIPAVAMLPVQTPRIAVYQSYLPTAGEGWTRWVLDHFEFPFTVIHNDDFKDRHFAKKYDAIIFPSQERDVIVDGKRVSKNRDYPAPFLPKKYRGGIGQEGIDALKLLVSNGGRLILLDAAYELAEKDFELPVRHVIPDKAAAKFNCPGSILQIRLETGDPLAWGMEPVVSLFFSNSAVFRAGHAQDMKVERFVAGRFAASGPHLLSGYLQGGENLDNAVAAVRYRYRKGQVVIFGGSILFRAQATATFKLFFNALLLP